MYWEKVKMEREKFIIIIYICYLYLLFIFVSINICKFQILLFTYFLSKTKNPFEGCLQAMDTSLYIIAVAW